MENTSHFVLSDYQRAILHEMGISSWKLACDEQNHDEVDSQSNNVVDTSTEVVAKADALEKLKQLKVQTQTNEITDSVVVTCSQDDAKLQIFNDVLRAFGLESKPLKHVSMEQLSRYAGYPLSWILGDKISFQKKQLTTPILAKLDHAETKRQLWLQIQSVLPLTKD